MRKILHYCNFDLELLAAIATSFTPNPRVVLLNTIFDIKGWMKPIRLGMHNIVYPHVFRLFVVDGCVKMQYKNWVNDPDWLPENSQGIDILKVDSTFNWGYTNRAC